MLLKVIIRLLISWVVLVAGPMAIQSHSQTPNKPLIDTSVLPPPLQMSWPGKRYDCTETGPNMHQKLERQLTLNPVSDPRIQMPPIIGDTIDVFSYPPPTLLTNFQQIHNSVQRKSSAPETASQRKNSRSVTKKICSKRQNNEFDLLLQIPSFFKSCFLRLPRI